MNNELVVMEKPEQVSWDSIHEVLWAAHESTRKDGIFYPTSEMTGEELKEFLEKHDGHCIVAMDGDKVAGTMSYYVVKINTRLYKGSFLLLALAGNSPDYKGRGVFSKIYNVCYDYAKANGLDGMMFGTAEKNHTMRNIFASKGFILHRIDYSKDKGRFVVGGILCFKKLRYPKLVYKLAFRLKQLLVHLKHR